VDEGRGTGDRGLGVGKDSGLLGYDTVMIVSLVLDDMKEHGTLIFKGQAVHIL